MTHNPRRDDIEVAVLYLRMPSKLHAWSSHQFTKLFDTKAQAMGVSLFDFSWMADVIFKGF